MRIGTINYRRPVQSLGRYNVNLPAAQFRAQAATINTALSAFGRVAEVYAANKVNNALYPSLSELQQNAIDLNNKQSYRADEVPEGVLSEEQLYTDVVQSDGSTISEPRQNIPAFEVTEAIYNKRVAAIKDAARKELGGLYSEWERRFMPYEMSTRTSVASRTARQATSYFRDSALQQAEGAINSGMPLSVSLGYLESSGVYNDVEIREIGEKLATQKEINDINDDVVQGDVDAMIAKRRELASENYSGNLVGEQKRSALRVIENGIELALADEVAAEKEANALQVSNLEIGVYTGKQSFQEIEQAFRDGVIDAGKRTQLYKMAHSVHQQGMKAKGQQILVDDILSGQREIDPADTNTQKAINNYVAQNPDRAAEVAIKTGYLPEQMRYQMSAAAYNGNPQEVQEASAAYGILQEQNPYLITKLSKEAEGVLNTTHTLNTMGVELTEAVKIARENARVSEAQREQLALNYKADVSAEDNLEELEDFMDASDLFDVAGGYLRDDEPPPEMQAEYAILTKQYYMINGGNIDAARVSAFRSIERTWGLTGVGYVIGADFEESSSKNMKYPPERVFNMSTARLNLAFDTFAKNFGEDPETLAILSDTLTARENSWRVYKLHEESGEFIELRNEDNSLLRWYPAQWFELTQEKVRRDRTQQARMMREARQDWDVDYTLEDIRGRAGQ